MWRQGRDTEPATHAIEPHPPREPRAMCPPTPPPESSEGGAGVGDSDVGGHSAGGGADECADEGTDGNTAIGLNLAQEHSLYIAAEGDEKNVVLHGSRNEVTHDSEKEKGSRQDGLETHTSFKVDIMIPAEPMAEATSMPTPESVAMVDEDSSDVFPANGLLEPLATAPEQELENGGESPQGNSHTATERPTQHKMNQKAEEHPASRDGSTPMKSAKAALTTDSVLPATPRYDFTETRLYPHYPTSFLRPGSRFSGTQQSDRQIYNVDVHILTLSVPEATLTGYLQIYGLTDTHPKLTTFFTGEIIGGPTHKHTFQTKDASWGATDRTDLQHWARFQAWRHLSRKAKEDINFQYPPPNVHLASTPTSPCQASPLPPPSSSSSSSFGRSAAPASNGEMGSEYEVDDPHNPGWWTQPNVFMRWKEWFLVPDHRVRSIQGASFEGFYYICFSQAEGKIHGIYFHARSEKYQQLELNHKFDWGVCGAMEFR